MPLLTYNELERMTPLFRGRIGKTFCKFILRILSIDKVNKLYDRNFHSKGPDFAKAVLADIGVEYEVINHDILKSLPEGPFITISNHPYGHIDGVILVDMIGRKRPDFKVMVNKFLSRIETLGDNFISVTPTGSVRTAPTKESIQGVKDAIAHVRSGGSLGLFPSGAVSDLKLKEGKIRDREWQEPIIRLIAKLNVPIVPIHFLDRNSNFYYLLGLIDWRVRLLKLPSEVFNKRQKKVRVAIGEIIIPQQQREFNNPEELRNFLRNKVYEQY